MNDASGRPVMSGQPPRSARDPFRLHRLALRAVDPGLKEMELHRLLQTIGESGVPGFFKTLNELGVASYWHQTILTNTAASATAPGLLDILKPVRLSEAMLYMAQKSALIEIDRLFEDRKIAFAVIKGAHVREQVYADPALRSAGDIDILVSRDQREYAVRELLKVGYVLHVNPENISHEATLSRGAVAIDLHWDILRPGRTRIEVADLLLARRQRVDGYWGLDDTDTVFLMLVHPAFAKYVCSPNMGLNRVFDFILWLQNRPVSWDAVAARLAQTGLNAAAWTMLLWFSMLLSPANLQVPETFIAGIRPGALRSRYLTYWVKHDLPTRWLHKPLLIQLGFTLFLHDRPGDVAHAIAGWWRARRMQNTDSLVQMLQTTQSCNP